MLTLRSAPAMIQQPRAPSSGLMPASDVFIRAKEVSSSLYCGTEVKLTMRYFMVGPDMK